MRGKSAHVSRAITIEAWFVLAFIGVTVWLFKSGWLDIVAERASDVGPFSSLLAGVLYATFATTPLAIGGFIAIADAMPLWQIALTGALGATLVDIFLMKGMRSPLAMLLVRSVVGHDVHVFRRMKGPLRWLAAIAGGVLIAVPLPTDELGIVLLGATHLRTLQIIPVVFVSDVLGIAGLLYLANILG